MTTYLVWTKDKEMAKRIITDSLVRNVMDRCEREVRETAINYIVKIGDKIKYKWIRPSESSRGQRGNVNLVDIHSCPFDIYNFIARRSSLDGRAVFYVNDSVANSKQIESWRGGA